MQNATKGKQDGGSATDEPSAEYDEWEQGGKREEKIWTEHCGVGVCQTNCKQLFLANSNNIEAVPPKLLLLLLLPPPAAAAAAAPPSPAHPPAPAQERA